MKAAKKRNKNPRRNPMRAKLIRAMAQGKTLTQASKEAGYAHIQSAHKSLANAAETMPSLLNRIGLTDEVAAKKYLAPLLEAKKTVYFQNGGIVMDKREVVDNGIRITALDMLFRLKNAYPNKLEIEHTGAIVHLLTETEKVEAQESLKRIAAFEGDENSESVIEGEIVDA